MPEVLASPLVGGDGIDLVVRRPGHRSVTVQLSMSEARELAKSISMAAKESRGLTVRDFSDIWWVLDA
jgi:hypothetical protein